jgi:hypothetical protein
MPEAAPVTRRVGVAEGRARRGAPHDVAARDGREGSQRRAAARPAVAERPRVRSGRRRSEERDAREQGELTVLADVACRGEARREGRQEVLGALDLQLPRRQREDGRLAPVRDDRARIEQVVPAAE